MTVNFLRKVAVVAWWLLITAGNSANTFANDGLKSDRYLGGIDRSAITRTPFETERASDTNPLRLMELEGTIEALENRHSEKVVNHSSQFTLKAFYATDASGLIAPLNSDSDSRLTLKAETRTTANNYGRIVLDRPSAYLAIVEHCVDLPARIQNITNPFLEYCANQELEIERRLAVPAALAAHSRSIPVISAGFSRPSVNPIRPVRSRTPLISPKSSNYRILLIESVPSEISRPTSIIEKRISDFVGAGQGGCEFFGECNKCLFGNSSGRSDSSSKLNETASIELTIPESKAIGSSSARSMFSGLGTLARTVKHFVGPYLNYARALDLMKHLQSIPPWIFSTIWPDYLGQNVSPFGILL